MFPIHISGTIVKGLGIGKRYNLPPTMNLRVRRIPKTLLHGIYAGRAKTAAGVFVAVMHYGLRPAVKAGLSFEVHCIGLKKNIRRGRVKIEIVRRIRSVKNFKTIAGLRRAIKRDIEIAKRLLENRFS